MNIDEIESQQIGGKQKNHYKHMQHLYCAIEF